MCFLANFRIPFLFLGRLLMDFLIEISWTNPHGDLRIRSAWHSVAFSFMRSFSFCSEVCLPLVV